MDAELVKVIGEWIVQPICIAAVLIYIFKQAR